MSLLLHLTPQAKVWMVAVLSVGGYLIYRRYKKPANTSRGTGGWMTLWQGALFRVFLEFSALDFWRRNPGILLGDWNRRVILPVYYTGNSNLLAVGPPGTQKTSSILIPNALRLKNMAVYDLDGQLSASCIKEWRRKGLSVQVINPMGMHVDTPYFIPCGTINVCDRLIPGSADYESRAQDFAESLVGTTDQLGDAKFFYEGAISGYSSLFQHNSEHEPPEHRNLARIRSYLRGNAAEWAKLIADMKRSRNMIVRQQANDWERMKNESPKQFTGVLDTMITATAWLDNPAFARIMADTTIRLDDLKGHDETGARINGAVFVILLPARYANTYAPFVRLMLAAMIDCLMSGPLARCKVNVLVDEAPTLKKFTRLYTTMTQARRYRMRFLLVGQSHGQFKTILGNDGFTTLEDSCEVKQFLGSWGMGSSTYVSSMVGEYTVIEPNGGAHGRSVETPDEVRRGHADDQIVFIGNRPPMKLGIRQYWRRPSLAGRFNPDPFHKGERAPLPALWPVEMIMGWALRQASGLRGPIAVIGSILLGIAIWGWR